MNTEWLILADHADIVGGKLYLNGGGWDRLTVNTGFPLVRSCGVAAAFRVPWNETNQRQTVEIEVLTSDGTSIARATGQLEVGRPPGIPAGQSQRAQLAVNFALRLEKPDTYEIVSRIEGRQDNEIHFNVVAGAATSPTRRDEGAV